MGGQYKFQFYNGYELLRNKSLLNNMKSISYEYDFLKEKDVLQFLVESSVICCMTKDEELIGFSWVEICEEEHIAELCWFVMSKCKTKALEGKLLLDTTLKYCKDKEVVALKFNCENQSWGRIKDKNKLFSRHGYILTKDENCYDVSIEV